jgi:cell division transport system permease protein
MVFTKIYRAFKYSLQDFVRNFWLSITTIAIIVLSLLSINSLIILDAFSQFSIQSLNEKINISIFFKEGATDNQIYEAQSQLLAYPKVTQVDFISKEDALDLFISRHENDNHIVKAIEEIDSNPLGATLVVKAEKTSDYSEILNKIQNAPFSKHIEETSYEQHKYIISKINTINSKIRLIGILITVLFTAISLIVVANTIRLVIYTHKNEIKIMKLVGASNWFIKSPYIIQSILFSFLACIVSVMILYPFLSFIQPYINNFFQHQNYSVISYFNMHFYLIFGTQFLICALLTGLSSSYSARKYLKI